MNLELSYSIFTVYLVLLLIVICCSCYFLISDVITWEEAKVIIVNQSVTLNKKRDFISFYFFITLQTLTRIYMYQTICKNDQCFSTFTKKLHCANEQKLVTHV